MKQYLNRIDLRVILFLIILLLVLYAGVASYVEPLPDDAGTLYTTIYQNKMPLLVPYDTISLQEGSSLPFRMAIYNNFYPFEYFHIGISCVDQYRPQKKADFVISLPEYARVPLGSAQVVEGILVLEHTKQPATALCRIELGNPSFGVPIIASKIFYIETLPARK